MKYNFKYFRRKSGIEVWVYTRLRGWITVDDYNEYLAYQFDPQGTSIECYVNLEGKRVT